MPLLQDQAHGREDVHGKRPSGVEVVQLQENLVSGRQPQPPRQVPQVRIGREISLGVRTAVLEHDAHDDVVSFWISSWSSPGARASNSHSLCALCNTPLLTTCCQQAGETRPGADSGHGDAKLPLLVVARDRSPPRPATALRRGHHVRRHSQGSNSTHSSARPLESPAFARAQVVIWSWVASRPYDGNFWAAQAPRWKSPAAEAGVLPTV